MGKEASWISLNVEDLLIFPVFFFGETRHNPQPMKSYKLLPFSVSILLALYATEVDCFLLNSKKAVTKVKLFSSVTPIKHGRTARTNKFDAKSNGGLIAKISCHFNTEFPEEVSTLVDYKQKVIDETEMLVVVRFHAKWCQACRAVQPRYRKLSRDFSGERIKFIECPVTGTQFVDIADKRIGSFFKL